MQYGSIEYCILNLKLQKCYTELMTLSSIHAPRFYYINTSCIFVLFMLSLFCFIPKANGQVIIKIWCLENSNLNYLAYVCKLRSSQKLTIWVEYIRRLELIKSLYYISRM